MGYFTECIFIKDWSGGSKIRMVLRISQVTEILQSERMTRPLEKTKREGGHGVAAKDYAARCGDESVGTLKGGLPRLANHLILREQIWLVFYYFLRNRNTGDSTRPLHMTRPSG